MIAFLQERWVFPGPPCIVVRTDLPDVSGRNGFTENWSAWIGVRVPCAAATSVIARREAEPASHGAGTASCLRFGRGGWRWARAHASRLLGWLAVQQHVRRRRDGPGALWACGECGADRLRPRWCRLDASQPSPAPACGMDRARVRRLQPCRTQVVHGSWTCKQMCSASCAN